MAAREACDRGCSGKDVQAHIALTEEAQIAARGSEPDRTAGAFRAVAMVNRALVRAFLAEVAGDYPRRLEVAFLPLASDAVTADGLAGAAIAVVDASVDPGETVAVVKAIAAARPDLPVTAVFCCPHAATAANLRALLTAGVGGLLDLQLSAEETLRVLRAVGSGQGAFHLQLAAGSSTSLSKLLSGDDEAEVLSDHDLGLLRLVALGLTDHEIGRRLYLSHHTVKHRIDRLRRRVQARNRVQLAAWAATHPALRDEPKRATY